MKGSSSFFTSRVTSQGVVFPKKHWTQTLREGTQEWNKIFFLIKSELRIKVFYKTFGVFFLLFEPILMAAVYYLLTMVILGSNVQIQDFLSIYTAVVFWRWFSRSIDNSPNLFASYASILKQTNFPIYSIFASFIGMEWVTLCLALPILIVFLSCFGYYPNWCYLFIPFIMLAQLSLTVFLSIVFSIIGTFFKDLQGILYAFTSIWFYLSPGIYPISRIPQQYLWVYQLNPFAHLLPAYRMIFLEAKIPPLLPLFYLFVVFSLLSVVAFQGLKKVRYFFFSYL